MRAPSALGLCALLCFLAARRRARVDDAGVLVPTSEQDPALWDHAFIDKGRALLEEASEAGELDRFQLEAAIEDALAVRAFGREVDKRALVLLYDGLVRVAPSVGALVARAAAVGDALGSAAGLVALEGLSEVAADYQPYWATRAHLTGDPEDLERAIALTTSLPARRYLKRKLVR